ncbi:MAG TPA: hypothetical protein VE225_03555 [Rubrobacteraceae bacterium]|nr:hypothetical protein [Rubrobacteraceae bacterium]
MRKLVMLAAILALALALAVPAIAQSIGQGLEPESGNVALNHTVVNKGNYASQCTPALQTGQSGNFDNSPGVLQVGGRSRGIEPEGVEVNFGGTVTADCPSTIQQSSAASK